MLLWWRAEGIYNENVPLYIIYTVKIIQFTQDLVVSAKSIQSDTVSIVLSGLTTQPMGIEAISSSRQEIGECYFCLLFLTLSSLSLLSSLHSLRCYILHACIGLCP